MVVWFLCVGQFVGAGGYIFGLALVLFLLFSGLPGIVFACVLLIFWFSWRFSVVSGMWKVYKTIVS